VPRVAYMNRAGEVIDQATYRAHLAEPSYVIVREYDNGQTQARLKWVGRIVDPHQTFPEFYKLFVLEIKNYTADGQLVPDPAEGQTFYPNEDAGIKAYETFLTKWTKSGVDEFGDFIEADNALIPPPPPDPNKPASEPDAPELGGVGAW